MLDCIVIGLIIYVLASLVTVGSILIAQKTSNEQLLMFGQGIGLVFALSPLALVTLFAIIAAPVLGVILLIQQVRQKDWIWLIAFVAGGLLALRFSMLPLIVLEIFYYFLVFRRQLQENTPPRVTRQWHLLFAALPLLLLAWVNHSPLFVSLGVISEKTSARMFVVKPAENAQAPFSLSTHSISIPQGFAYTRDWRGQDILDIRNLTFSPDGTRAAFLVSIGGNTYVVIDGQAFTMEKGWYSGQLEFLFSDDSERLLFIVYDSHNMLFIGTKESRQIGSFLAIKDRHNDTLTTTLPLKTGEITYVFDGHQYMESDFNQGFTRLESLQSSDGKRSAVVEEVGSCGTGPTSCLYHVKVTENGRTVFQSRNYDGKIIRNLAFSPDGKSIAYVVGRVSEGLENESYQSFVAVDDKPSLLVDAIGNKTLQFSPDGKYIVYGAQEGDKIWWIVEEATPDPDNATVSTLQDVKIQASSSVPPTSLAASSSSEQNSSSIAVPTPLPVSHTPFHSAYFTLSFSIPSGFEVKEDKNYVAIAQSPYYTRDIGDDNAFMRLTRYDRYRTREGQIALYRKLLKNFQESHTMVDGSSFLTLKGDDWGRFEGDSAGKVVVVIFEASWLEIIERPANKDQNFDPVGIGGQILSTFRFFKS